MLMTTQVRKYPMRSEELHAVCSSSISQMSEVAYAPQACSTGAGVGYDHPGASKCPSQFKESACCV